MLNRRKGKAALFSFVRIDPISKCWVWQGGTNGRYGHVHFQGETWLTHRLSFAIFHGEIPPGYIVHHTCRNRLCVNPSHLIAIPQAENIKLAAKRGAYRGERNRNSRLTRDEIYAIKIMREIKGLTQKCISEMTGIHRSTISDVCRGRCWNHLSL